MLEYSSYPNVKGHITLQTKDGATGKICLTATLDVNHEYKVSFQSAQN